MLTVAQKSLRKCSFYFCLLSALLACLIGLGTDNWLLVLLVACVALVGFFYTDVLGWFHLPRSGVIVLMIAGAVLAVGQFLQDAGGERINAVGNLLIYVQMPLMFQQKSKRVFEQWGVFLLLELVVAALVNSDVLFGLLMIPVLIAGVLAMMSLAAYCALELHNQSQTERNDWWTKFRSILGRQKAGTKLESGIRLQVVSNETPRFQLGVWDAMAGRMRLGAFVLSFGVMFFTAMYFYMLPRMSVGAFEVTAGWGGATVGISDHVSLRYRGNIRPNDTPVLRMQLSSLDGKTVFLPVQPPYIRMTILSQYLGGATRGMWVRGEPLGYGKSRTTEKIPVASELMPELVESSDAVMVSILEKSTLREAVASMPPLSAISNRKSFAINKLDWAVVDTGEGIRTRGLKRNYAFRTYAFQNGIEKRVLPPVMDSFEADGPAGGNEGLYWGVRQEELTQFPASLSGILPFRDELLADCQSGPTDRLGRAVHLEQKLAYSPEFTYSLKQTPPVDPSLDPIADFLLHRKRGHCEYYASSLAMFLRSMNIPARIVLGFRPVDYNEVGSYYIVKQEHAHAWVEGYFSREEIQQQPSFERHLPSFVSHGAWVRFDPTPAGEGSNGGVMFRTEGGQALTAMQDFWSEMIMNMDRSRQNSMFNVFGEASGGSYLILWEDFQARVNELRNHPFFAGLASPRNWFSWRAAMVIFSVGGVLLIAYQAWVWFFPGWRFGALRSRRRRLETQVPFYNRLMQAMRRLDLEPQLGQTPREFWTASAALLKSRSIAINADLIADSFYALRYGDAQELGQEKEKLLEEQLQTIEGVSRLQN